MHDGEEVVEAEGIRMVLIAAHRGSQFVKGTQVVQEN